MPSFDICLDFTDVLIRVSIAAIKHHGQKQADYTSTLQFTIEGSQEGTQMAGT